MRKRADSQALPPSYILVGTSAGGPVALSRLFTDLPEDFPGAILIVMHMRGEYIEENWLTRRLAGHSHIPVKTAEEGEVIRQGTAYIAPMGKHLLVEEHRIKLGMGPAEQYVRPAIDVLFRSAASAFGSRAIGVILTGLLSDGTMGLRAIRDAGGITIVQDPREAEKGDMPRNAMKDLNVDYCLKLSEIGPLLDLLVRRAGPHKQGVLETGLASAVRLMKDRARLLTRLYAQSRGNPKTERFLNAEITALEEDIANIKRMLPRE
jgi:two-component system chemotaxis response regulator CheB